MSGVLGKKIKRIVAILVLVVILAVALFNLVTNLLWFNEVGYESVFLKRLLTQALIAVPVFLIVSSGAFFYLKALRKCYHKKVAPPVNDKETNKALGRNAALLSAAVALLATIFTTNTTWFKALEFMNSTNFGVADPVFNLDISFYVFRLDLIKQLNTIAFSFIIGFAAISFIYYMTLNMRNPPPAVDEDYEDENEGSDGWKSGDFSKTFDNITNMFRGAPQSSDQSRKQKPKDGTARGLLAIAPTQAMVLGALFFLALGVSFLLKQFDLLYSTRGALYGAGYTDVNITLWVNRILMVMSVLGAVGVVVALKKQNIKALLAVPVVMLAIGLLGAGTAAVVQSFIVSADEINLENRYLARNIEFTQYAYSLDNVSTRAFPVSNTLTREDIENNYETISNIRINDDEPVRRFYNNVQTIRPYYVFTDVYVDRYMVNGEYTQVYIAAREIDDSARSPIPQTFLNSHIKYTHGYGITLSRVDRISASGLPEMLIRNIPPESDVPEITLSRPQGRPEIYFGRMTNDFILVNTTEPEFDYPIGGADDGRNAEVFYEGGAGIKMTFLNRLLFSIREGDARILVSSALTNDSRIIINRNVMQRIKTIMPQLTYDPEPYMVTADGRLFWVVDAYTHSGNIPYSAPYNGSINYIRNSVKIVIDAFHGTTNFYVVDPNDPIIATYRKIFPELFKDLAQIDEMSPQLRNHLRYPNMLLNVQANMYRRYHMSDVTMFYQNEDLWDIATEIFGSSEQQMVSNYYIMKLPGEQKAEFVNTIPFTPGGRRNMSALLLARNDGAHYGELVLFQLPKGRQIPGPMQVDAQTEQDGQISQDIALWGQSGSIVNRGNMFIVPIENSFLYVKPIYLEAEAGSIPEVRRVVVAYGVPDGDGVRLAYQPTLEQALEELFGPPTAGGSGAVKPPDPVDPQDPGATTPPTDGAQSVAKLIALVSEAFENAQRAQKNGDWAAYGQYLTEMEHYLGQLQDINW